MSIRTDRVAKLLKMIESGEQDVIRFIRMHTTVHILALPEDRPARHKELFGDDDGDALMRGMLGEEWSICGDRFVQHARGFESGAQRISHFPDDDLCWSCHKAFGTEHGHLIFDANQDDGRDPSTLGRLDEDLITRGKKL